MNGRSVPRVRLLPMTLLVAVLVFTVKLGDVWHGVAGLRMPAVVTPAVAADTPADPAPTGSTAAVPAPAVAAPQGMPLLPGEGMTLTATEIELLQKLSARREAIEKRERELDMREALAEAAEARLVAKTAELDRLQKSIEALARAHDEQEAAKIESLVTIYEKMKPRDAARILEGLEMGILIDVLGRMKEIRSAPILASMAPEKARAVTARLAEHKMLLKADG